MSLSTVRNESNLVNVKPIFFYKIKEDVAKNNFLNLTKGSFYKESDKERVLYLQNENGDRKILMVEHYETQNKGPIKPAYKVDRILMAAANKRYEKS